MRNDEPHVLIVDDDREIRDLVSRFLRKNGLRVTTASDGQAMLQALADCRIDLIVLDRMLPNGDGVALCRRLRQKSRIPVVMLTLLGSESDRIAGLETGADDYVVKPFSPKELLARIRAVLRRANELPAHSGLHRAKFLRFAGWTLNRVRRQLTSPDGTAISLTDGEFDLLLAFAEHPQIMLSRNQLSELVRGRDLIPFDRGIDVQVGRLRRKIEVNPEEPQFIKAVRGQGYTFTPDVEEA
jgi:two-component system, OmpR family, response regulator